MADVLVLNDDIGLNNVLWSQAEGLPAERCNQSVLTLLANSKDIDIQVIARTQELNRLAQLVVEAVVEGHSRVAGQPAMRRKGSVFRPVIRQGRGIALHVASLARCEVRGIEGERIALGKLGLLPLVVSRERANELVVVKGCGQICLVAGCAEFRLVQEVVHHGFGMPLRVTKDLVE